MEEYFNCDAIPANRPMKRILLATVFGLLLTAAMPAAARKWTSNDGKFSTEAELVEFADGKATLKKSSGETITVPILRLSEEDSRFLRSTKNKPAVAKEKPKPKGAAFSQDIDPLLTKYCAGCHSRIDAKDGYDVTSLEALTRSGKNGALVVPGRSAASRLVLTMQGRGKPMPPKEYPQPTADEIATIARWIDAGARDDSAAPAQPQAGPAKGKLSGRNKSQ